MHIIYYTCTFTNIHTICDIYGDKHIIYSCKYIVIKCLIKL